MKKRYACLIFDADHTLLNYLADEKKAFCALYNKLGMTVTDDLLALSRVSSENAWTEAGLYNVIDPVIQKKYHGLYRTHTEEIFNRIFSRFPCATCTAKEAGLQFLQALEIVGEPLGNSLEIIKQISDKAGGKHATYIATNGLSSIQHKRLEEYEKRVRKAYVSEDLQSVKPLPVFFESILAETGFAASECLMIGDSLISDIGGASAVGMDGCWFNPEGISNRTGITPTYTISKLEELLTII